MSATLTAASPSNRATGSLQAHLSSSISIHLVRIRLIRCRRAPANIVYIDGPRLFVRVESEDQAPASHPSSIRSLVTATQLDNIAGERVFLHFE